MAATADLLVRVKGDTSDANSKLGKLGGKLGGVAKVAAGAAVGVGVAVAALGVKSVTAFAGFEKGMNEVFTLMPGISDKAMGAMSDDVLALSKKMGVLPDDIIPALYDSISAGVPADSVFSFLETATKASIGGVTDLGTAVDGITSTVNAFGEENVNAAQASDLMFTAVKLGKTTMEELSKSLFQVNPIAAGLGVQFSDVTASLAALTSQGVPTSVAAVQMKGALAELGKGGTKADKAFRQLAGKGFKDFIAGGGNVQEAFELMKRGSEDAGVEVTDFFGSIEAGSAVLALTSATGSKAFSKAMDGMADSAGATGKAFDTMDQGLSRSWDKIKAQGSAAFIELGSAIAPVVEKLVDWFVAVLPGAIEWVKQAFNDMKPTIDAVVAFLSVAIPQAIEGLIQVWNTLAPIVTAVWKTIFDAISTVVSWFQGDGGVGGVTKSTSEIGMRFQKLADRIGPIFAKIQKIISGVMEVITKVTELAMSGISALWETHGAAIIETVVTVFEGIVRQIEGFMAIIQGIIDVVMGVLTGDWERAWDGIKGIVTGAFDLIVGIFEQGFALMKLSAELALDLIENIVELAWNAIATATTTLWGNITGAISNAWSNITGAVTRKTDEVKATVRRAFMAIPGIVWDFLTRAFNTVNSRMASMVGAVVTKMKDFLSAIRNRLSEVPGMIGTWFVTIYNKAKALGGQLIAGIVAGLGGLKDAMIRSLKRGISSAIKTVKTFFGIRSPSKVMMEQVGVPLAQGIVQPQEDAVAFTKSLTGGIPGVPVTGGTGDPRGSTTVVVEGNLFGAATVSELAELLRDELDLAAMSGA